MAQKVTHRLRQSYLVSVEQYAGGVVKRMRDIYFCNRIVDYLNDDQPLDDKERLRLDKQKLRLEINPPPVCKQCQRNFDKFKVNLSGVLDI